VISTIATSGAQKNLIGNIDVPMPLETKSFDPSFSNHPCIYFPVPCGTHKAPRKGM